MKNKINEIINNTKHSYKRFCNSHASVARCLFVVLTMITINIYFVWSDFLEENNVFTSVSQVIMQYSAIIFILLGGVVLCYDTYINRSSARKISFGTLGAYLVVFVEARFIIKQDFDKWFWIIIVNIIILHSIPDSTKSMHNKQEVESANSYSPITRDVNLFKSRKSQQNYLLNLIQDKNLIDSGMSICITGKWGSGKTSFVNATLDILSIKKIEFEEIRINALELEETTALIKYYFTRIKEILESNNAYIGIKSEYRSLMSSLLNSATSEDLSGFIMSSFEEKEDYRNMISEVSEIINNILTDSRIIIVVDDIERCSDNKIKQLLFFIKEVATMKKCVSLFLIDEVKMFQSSCFGGETTTAAEFVDKFFDEVISLKTISIPESIERFKDVKFEKLINSLLEYYNKRIVEINDDANIGHRNDQECEETKKKELEDVNTKAQAMKSIFSNPRRLKKIYSFYNRYIFAINEIIDSVEDEREKKEEFTRFLTNIEFEKQILIISILQDSFKEQYNHILNEEIDSISRYLSQECWLKEIIIKEWFPLVSDYFTFYKLAFSDALIKNNHNEILKMVNPFSNEYDEYKNSIHQGKIPVCHDTNISLLDCFEVLHTNNRYDSDLIKKMFEVYKQTITFDEALRVLYSKSIVHAREIAVIEFADAFCTPNCKINNVETCRERFESVYPRILWKLLLNYKVYFCHHDLHLDENVEESVFNNPSFNESINIYVTKVCRMFNYSLNASGPIEKLKEILDKVKKDYSTKKYPVDEEDFKNLMKCSTTALKRIEALARIERFINSQSNHSLPMPKTLMDEINKIIDIIRRQKDNNEEFLDYSGFRDFLKKVEQNGLSSEEKAEYEKMIGELSEIDLNYSIWARQIFIKLYSHEENTSQS